MLATTTANNATSALDVMTANLHKLETAVDSYAVVPCELALYKCKDCCRVKEETIRDNILRNIFIIPDFAEYMGVEVEGGNCGVVSSLKDTESDDSDAPACHI